eukprot:5978604-Amphidinium_carterae.1
MGNSEFGGRSLLAFNDCALWVQMVVVLCLHTRSNSSNGVIHFVDDRPAANSKGLWERMVEAL